MEKTNRRLWTVWQIGRTRVVIAIQWIRQIQSNQSERHRYRLNRRFSVYVRSHGSPTGQSVSDRISSRLSKAVWLDFVRVQRVALQLSLPSGRSGSARRLFCSFDFTHQLISLIRLIKLILKNWDQTCAAIMCEAFTSYSTVSSSSPAAVASVWQAVGQRHGWRIRWHCH